LIDRSAAGENAIRDTRWVSDEVRRAAERFRRALEGGGLVSAGLQCFPRGACADSSDLLADYLRGLGLGEWTLHRGRLGRDSHAWLWSDGLIVDVTADQFEGISSSVLVTTDRSWHDLFELDPPRPAGLSQTDGPALPGLRSDFAVLVARAASAG
jgi:hypothetical protein